jgi:uncharacterized membrane protein YeaQ/YmgE (transglycosylase-associated protein family)
MENLVASGGGLVLLVLMILISGFVIGGLARWIMPGPDPMSIGKTILLGIVGSLIGGLVGRLLNLSPLVHPFGLVMLTQLLLEIAGAVLVLWIVRRYRRREI